MGACLPLPADRRTISGPAQRLELRSHNVLSSGILSIHNGFLEFKEADGRSLRWETQNLKEFSCDRAFFLFTASQLCQHPGSYVFRTARARNYFRSINLAINTAAQPQNVAQAAPPRAAYDPLNETERVHGRALAAAAAAAAAAGETPSNQARLPVYVNTINTDAGATGTGTAGSAPGQHIHSLSNIAPVDMPRRDSPTHATPLSTASNPLDEVGGSDIRESYQDRIAAFVAEAPAREPARSNYNKLKDITPAIRPEPSGSGHGSASPSQPCPLERTDNNNNINNNNNDGNGNSNVRSHSTSHSNSNNSGSPPTGSTLFAAHTANGVTTIAV